MKFIAQVHIMPLKELLDPQGKAVTDSLHNLGLTEIKDVRVGKNITLAIEAVSEEQAREKTDEACRKLLANLVMESYAFEITAG